MTLAESTRREFARAATVVEITSTRKCCCCCLLLRRGGPVPGGSAGVRRGDVRAPDKERPVLGGDGCRIHAGAGRGAAVLALARDYPRRPQAREPDAQLVGPGGLKAQGVCQQYMHVEQKHENRSRLFRFFTMEYGGRLRFASLSRCTSLSSARVCTGTDLPSFRRRQYVACTWKYVPPREPISMRLFRVCMLLVAETITAFGTVTISETVTVIETVTAVVETVTFVETVTAVVETVTLLLKRSPLLKPSLVLKRSLLSKRSLTLKRSLLL